MKGKVKKPILSDSTNTYRNNFPSFEPSHHSKLYFENLGKEDAKPSLASCDTTIDDSMSTCSNNTQGSFISGSDVLDNSDAKSSCYQDGDDYTMMNSALGQKKKAVTDETKYKTELCKNYSETGQCPYGKKCKFAHGKTELNEKRVANKGRYKSKKCNSFHTQMYCPYGVRCLFAHEQRTAEELQSN